MAGLVVDITDLLISLDVEISHFLARRGIERLLEIRSQSTPVSAGLVSDFIFLIKTLGSISGFGLVVESGERGSKAAGEAVFLVQSNRFLDCLVADRVTLSEILGDNPRARLVLLFNIVMVFVLGLLGTSGMTARDLVDAVSGFHVHGGGTELSIIQQQCSLGCSIENKIIELVIRSNILVAESIVKTHVSFSKVTVADLGALASPDSAVKLRLEIFPL